VKKVLVSFLLMLSLVVSPAISHAFSTQDLLTCVKLVSGYDYGVLLINQAAGLVEVAIAHPECQAQLLSEDPVFYSLLATAIALKNTTSINTKDKCQNLLNGMVDQGIGAAFANNAANLTPQQKADLQSAAGKQAKHAISNIPGMQYWSCACEYAHTGLIVSDIKNIVQKESTSLKICGDVTKINDVISGVAEGLGLTCPNGKTKMTQPEYITKYLLPDIRKYALMNTAERESQCMLSTSVRQHECYTYYTSGSVACRMSKDHSLQQCNAVMDTFRKMVLAYQPTIVSDAVSACSKVGYGCIKDKYEPLQIDAYGDDAYLNCFSGGIQTLLPSCKPKEQPCCKKLPLTPEIKCKKAQDEAVFKVGDLGSQIGQSFNNLSDTWADAQMIADRKACQQTIMANALKYVQSAACDAAMNTPTDDISGIWPAVLQAAKGLADGEGYTKCDGPYNKKVKIIGCKNKCAQPGFLKAVYNRTDSGAEMQCNQECLSGVLNVKTCPGCDDMKRNQQSSCLSQCFPLCDGNVGSAACNKCKDACSSGTGSGSGSGSGWSAEVAACAQQCDMKYKPNTNLNIKCRQACSNSGTGFVPAFQ
jgi:hypothetical protein